MRATILPLFALLLGTAILLVGAGLHGILLPMRGVSEAFPTTALGIMSAAYSLGYVLSCVTTPLVVQRVGHIRAFTVFAALAAATALMTALLVDPVAWILLRAVSGICMAALMMIIESWLNEKASNENRGSIFSIYMVVNLGSVTGGQMLLGSADVGGFTLFAIVAIAVALSLVPVALTRLEAPQPITGVKLRLAKLYRASPVGVLGCLTVGLANGSFGGLGPVFAAQSGLESFQVALFQSAAVVGGALAQLPLGKLSDRIDRRKVMVGCCLVAALLGPGMIVAAGMGMTVLIAASFAFGMAIFPLYGLSVAHANDFVAREDFVETSGGLLTTYGIGAVVGPMVASGIMQVIGNWALFIYTAGIHLAFCAFALYRMSRRNAPQQKDNFVDVLPAATQQALVLDPRGPEQLTPEPPEPSVSTAAQDENTASDVIENERNHGN
jgi:MFS family permease